MNSVALVSLQRVGDWWGMRQGRKHRILLEKDHDTRSDFVGRGKDEGNEPRK